MAPTGSGKGFGLFACEDVQKLAFVCEYAGEVVGVSEACKRMGWGDGGMNYLIVLREHCATGVVLTCVDPRCMGNIGRFANHSCNPNLLMVPVRVDNSVPRLALFARRDITAGEELTFDYSGETVLDRSASPGGAPQNVESEDGLNKAQGEINANSDSDKGTATGCVGQNCEAKIIVKDDVNHVYPEAVSSDERSFNHDELGAEKLNVQNDVKGSALGDERCDESHRFDNKDTLSHISSNPVAVSGLFSEGQTSCHCNMRSSVSETLKDSVERDEVEERTHTKDSALQLHGQDDGEGRTCRSSIPWRNDACLLNARKRKLVDGAEAVNRDVEGQKSDRQPQTKGLVLSETGTVLATQKPCLCGSACCRGYLPFDSLIFSLG